MALRRDSRRPGTGQACPNVNPPATGVTGGRADLSRWYGWWWNWYARAEVRDDRVALFAPYLSRGTYEYSYTIRVTTAGRFNVIPTFANDRYFPEVFGRGDGELMVFER